MRRLATILIVTCPGALSAHPCPFDWNINFANATEITGEGLGDFVEKFNEAVRKETKGVITEAIIYDARPDTFRKVPEDTRFSKEMDELFRRYAETMRPLVKRGLGDSAPIAIRFPAKIPVACMLSAQFSGAYTSYEEVEEGACVIRQRALLECRPYQVSAKFMETVDAWEREDRIETGLQPASYTFASLSGMTWAFDTYSESEQDYVQVPFIEGVTLFIPEKKIVLAIETKVMHEEMTKVMTERGYLVNTVQDGAKQKKQDAPQNPGQR